MCQAFVVVGTSLSRTKQRSLCAQERAERLVLVPNNRLAIAGEGAWYEWLSEQLPLPCELARGFPNPYDANTKRWESIWLRYLREEAKIDRKSVVIGHGTGADAVLRMLENTEAFGAVLVAPCDEYHAGERHGRPYHWSDIRRNCLHFVKHIHSDNDPFVTEDESRFVGRQLKDHESSLLLQGRGRFSDQVFEELLQILLSTL